MPGPGLYKPSNTDKRNAPRYGFGSEMQRAEVAKGGRFATPAPGDYATKELMGKEGVSVTMGTLIHDKTKEKKDRQVPGPGHYNQVELMSKTAPNWGFGTSQ